MTKEKTETLDQIEIVRWFELNYPDKSDLLFGNILAGTYIPGKNNFKNYHRLFQAKKAGSRKGYPDLSLHVARGGYHALFIEYKTLEAKSPYLKNGSYSSAYPEQVEYGKKLILEGYYFTFGVGVKSTIDIIKNYMEGKLIR